MTDDRRLWYSPRGVPLVYLGELPNIPHLTVEWYELFLVGGIGDSSPEVRSVSFGELSEIAEEMGACPYVDHVPNPAVVEALAKKNGWLLDSQSFEMIVGRWQLEVLGAE